MLSQLKNLAEKQAEKLKEAIEKTALEASPSKGKAPATPASASASATTADSFGTEHETIPSSTVNETNAEPPLAANKKTEDQTPSPANTSGVNPDDPLFQRETSELVLLIRKMQEKLKSLDKKFKDEVTKDQRLEEENRALKEKLANSVGANPPTGEMSMITEQDFQNATGVLRAELKNKVAEIEQLTEMNNTLRNELTLASSSSSSASSTTTQSEEESKLQNALDEARRLAEESRAALEIITKEKEELAATVMTLTKANKALEKEGVTRTEQMRAIQREALEYQNETLSKMKEMEADIARANEALKAVEARNLAANAENGEEQDLDVTISVADLRNERETLSAELALRREEVAMMERQIKSLTEANERNLAGMQAELETMKQTALALEEMDRLKVHNEELGRELEKLREDATRRENEMREEAKRREEEITTSYASRLDRVEKELKEARERLTAKDAEIEAAKNTAVETTRDSLSNQITELQTELNTMRTRVEVSEAEARARGEEMERERARAEAAAAALEEEKRCGGEILESTTGGMRQEYEARLRTLEEGMQAAAARAQDAETALEEERRRASETTTALVGTRAELEEIRAKQDEKEEEAQAARAAAGGFERRAREAEQALVERTAALESLQEKTHAALTRAGEEAKTLKVAEQRIKDELVAMRKERDELAASERRARDEIVAARETALKSHAEELARLREEAESRVEVVRREGEERLAEFRAETAAQVSAMGTAGEALRKAEEEAGALREENTTLKQEMRTRRERAERLLAEQEATIERLKRDAGAARELANELPVAREALALFVAGETLDARMGGLEEVCSRLGVENEIYERLRASFAEREAQIASAAAAEEEARPKSNTSTNSSPSENVNHNTALSNNHMYLKNVLVSYMLTEEPKDRLLMLPAIAQLLTFTRDDETRVRRHLQSDAEAGLVGKVYSAVLGSGKTPVVVVNSSSGSPSASSS